MRQQVPTSIKLAPNAHQSYKIGVDEILGLKTAMQSVLKPVLDTLNAMESWSGDGWFQFSEAEYKSRDGFIAHSHNCGGIEIRAHLPKCGESDFPFIEFGECDECGNAETYPEGDHQCGYHGQECAAESDGHLDAYLRIWLKFEGIQSDGSLEFYLVMEGGNNDAPYFRSKYLPTLFEATFSCKSVAGLKRASSKAVKALLKEMEK